MSLKDRVKKVQGKENVESIRKPPESERKVDGWLLRVMGRETGLITSPDGVSMTMRYNPNTGIATLVNTLPVLSSAAVEKMAEMLRIR